MTDRDRAPVTTAATLLGGYRVLDLTEGGFSIGGKMLADMGADVIKVEEVGGSPTRSLGPFYGGIPSPERSLFWFAYNANKRGITLDLRQPLGQEIFRRLAKTADFVLESYPPGYLASLGLGYRALSEVNPRLIVASVTPFGQTGPYAGYKGGELVTWAKGGYMSLCGDPDRPPVWVSFPQAYLHAGAEAATACMLAHYHRERTGEGQHVDVSAQECAVVITANAWPLFLGAGFLMQRSGSRYINPLTRAAQSYYFPCQDGMVFIWLGGGGLAADSNSSLALAQWMDEEGMAPSWLMEIDWARDFALAKRSQELLDRVQEAVARFVRTKTKRELYEEAVKRRIMLGPLSTAADLWENVQLRAREFWVSLEHPELSVTLPYCGPFVKLSETPLKITRRAPLIGEHNVEVYAELGIAAGELAGLKEAGVI